MLPVVQVKTDPITVVDAVPSSVTDVESSGRNAYAVTGCQNYSTKELSKLLTERLHNPWHLLFVNSAWWLWHRSYKRTMSAITVANSLGLKDRAAARHARSVVQDTGSTSYPADVAIC